jgi:hypothetical protein
MKWAKAVDHALATVIFITLARYCIEKSNHNILIMDTYLLSKTGFITVNYTTTIMVFLNLFELKPNN